jgi:hypothetical protein
MSIGAVLTFGLATRTGSTSTLVHFAPPFTDPAGAPSGVRVLPEHRGYDGQFYYRLTVAPLSTADRVDGVAFDLPALRMSRIGYPAFARVLAAGPISTVDAMLLANVLAFGGIGFAGVAIAVSAGRSPPLGVALLFVPAFVYAATMSVTDAVAGALLLGGVAFLQRQLPIWAAVALSGAALTRETALLLPLMVLVHLADERLRHRGRGGQPALLAPGLAPFVVAGAWQIVVYAKWSELGPLSSGSNNLTVPFLGPFQTDGFLAPSSSEEWLNILVPLASAGVVAAVVLALLRREPSGLSRPLVMAFVTACAVATAVGPALLESYRNSVRGIGDATVFAGVAALHGRGPWSRIALVGLTALGAVLMLWELRIAPDLT